MSNVQQGKRARWLHEGWRFERILGTACPTRKAFLESDGSNRVWSGKKALEWIIAHEERTLEAWETVAPGMKRSMDRYGNLDHQELSLTFAVYHVANWDTAPLFEIMEAQENKGKKREEREGEPIRPRVKGENEESQLAAGSSSKKRQVEDEGDRLHPDERFKEVTMRGPLSITKQDSDRCCPGGAEARKAGVRSEPL